MLRLTRPEKPFRLVRVILVLDVKVLFWYAVRLLVFGKIVKSGGLNGIEPGLT